MRKLLVLLVLAGCATEPSSPTDGQLAMWAYWASLCGTKTDYSNIEDALRTDAVLRGCVTTYALRADAAYRAGQTYQPNALEASGQVLMESGRSRQQRCDTTPTYGGGSTTTCY